MEVLFEIPTPLAAATRTIRELVLFKSSLISISSLYGNSVYEKMINFGKKLRKIQSCFSHLGVRIVSISPFDRDLFLGY